MTSTASKVSQAGDSPNPFVVDSARFSHRDHSWKRPKNSGQMLFDEALNWPIMPVVVERTPVRTPRCIMERRCGVHVTPPSLHVRLSCRSRRCLVLVDGMSECSVCPRPAQSAETICPTTICLPIFTEFSPEYREFA